MLQRPISLQPSAYHLIAVLTIFSIAVVCAHQLRGHSKNTVQHLQTQLRLATAQNTTAKLSASAIEPVSTHGIDQWPSRQSVDAVVEQAGQEALRRGIVIRSLSATHQAASSSSWGKVTLDVLTIGSYTASKAWQSALMEAYPSLALQNLRVQTAPGALGVLESRWTWVLHVRD